MKPIILALVLIATMDLFPQKVGDAYALDINNIYLPIHRTGILADINISPGGSGGQFGGNTFLFSGGFFLSGYSNGQLWANAVASSSLVQDYLQGTYASGQNDPRAQLYRLRSDDIPFGQSWQDWIDAVALGADFYDGNGDQIYNPIDLNGNNQWDPDEDHPDLLGDETIWCVFHDAAAGSRWTTVQPQGIEIRQTVFAYSSQGPIKNTVFIRYRIKYVGRNNPGEPDTLDQVYFGIWDDPDLGDSQDDLVGCDLIRAVGFTYNNGVDPIYGNNPPCFIAKTFAGPNVYIPGVTFIDMNGNGIYDEGFDIALDTARVHRGQLLGITKYPGADNLHLTSAIHYINGDSLINDPSIKEEARNYMLGLIKTGEVVDPCTWSYGEVRGGIDCSTLDPMFWYSGDPVLDVGWINITAVDQRQMQNLGPFKLVKGEEQEVFIAYSLGQGSDALTSIDVAKSVSDFTHVLYDINFDPFLLSAEDKTIDMIPNEFNLGQNYPNPFNPSTTIRFTIAEFGFTILKVYDILGNEVATLFNEEKPAGTYEINWYADGLPSGVYFYRIQAGDFIETKQMMLMK